MPSVVDKIKLSREQDRRVRFNDDEITEIRELYASGLSQKAIAEIYGTCQSTISYIVSDKVREHLAEYRKVNPPKRRTKEEAREYMVGLRKYKKKILQKKDDSNAE